MTVAVAAAIPLAANVVAAEFSGRDRSQSAAAVAVAAVAVALSVTVPVAAKVVAAAFGSANGSSIHWQCQLQNK